VHNYRINKRISCKGQLNAAGVVACLVFVSMGNKSPAPGRAHGHSYYFITRSTNFTAIRVSVTISQPLVTLTKRAHRSLPPRLLQEEHGCLAVSSAALALFDEAINQRSSQSHTRARRSHIQAPLYGAPNPRAGLGGCE